METVKGLKIKQHWMLNTSTRVDK